MKIAITTSSFGKYDSSPLDRLKEANIQYVINPLGKKLSKKEIIQLAKDVDCIIAGTELLNKQVLNNLPKLKIISRCGVGTDNVDHVTAENLGIKVFNTPYGPTLAVAELTVGLILDLLRKVTQMDRELRTGVWKKWMGNLLHDKKIGMVGFGRIGQKVAKLLLAFGVEIGYCDISKVCCNLPCTCKELKDLLAWADIISLHLSSSRENELIFSENEIQQMKKGAWFVNVARGALVDEEALFKALKEGHLSGAALDVFEKEPYSGPLSTLENVILTPHIGSYALEARVFMEKQAVENLITGLTV
jgi:D-3-phosphoglycerate dehydrogenase / 2-oxoglutarate reductase